MCLRQFILVFMFILVSNADEENDNSLLLKNNYENGGHEGSPCEMRISAALSGVKTELSYIYTKMDSFEKKEHFIEESIHEHFHKLEKNIIDKLEEYIEGKIDSLQKHTNRKLDALEKNTPDKIDILLLHKKIDNMKKMQTESSDNVIFDSNKLINMTNGTSGASNDQVIQAPNLAYFEKKLEKKLEVISKKKFEEMNKNIYSTLNILTKNLMTLKDNIDKTPNQDIGILINETLSKLNNGQVYQYQQNMNLADIEEKIDDKLKAINETISSRIDANIAYKLNSMQKNISGAINSTQIENINAKLNEMQQKFTMVPTKETKSNKTFSEGVCVCKKRVSKGFDLKLMRMDNETFNHVNKEFDENGFTKFEMKLAIKSNSLMIIQFSSVPDPGKNETYISVGVHGSSKVVWLYITRPKDGSADFVTNLQQISTPNILSPTIFSAFYIKIYDKFLEFGKEGENVPPILRYKDDRFRTFKYIGFTAWTGVEGSFLYDCPPGYEVTLN